ncbi:MAG: putative GTP-binding protein EngB [Parcubacteria group bacterium GW2011_GWF2_38_76]|nr:MAG: putative GTP-binding protein EngB [Parcubacteria group bacterium GW2011_GWF2_38_76]HBM45464.1 ribosome biogenesis GTP-binding protein YsxC [Patescibacteria group bacterium]
MRIESAIFRKGIRGNDNILFEEKPQVAFVGRSNVGKSSLMNCLLNRNDLVKSGKMPGKTREINFFLVNGKILFVDLPGYGYANLPIDVREQLVRMIQWYFFQKVFKRKAVLVLDAKVGPNDMDIEMYRILREQREEVIIVANKIDTLNQKEKNQQIKMISEKMPGAEIIPCSAKTKEGRDLILKRIFS